MSRENKPDEKSLEKIATQWRNALGERISEWANWVEGESPIEVLLGTALLAQESVCYRAQTHIVFVNQRFPLPIEQCPPVSRFCWPLFVEAQKLVEDVRVDFLISTQIYDDRSGETVGFARLIVECDGHEYHERTKEQASRDRARDRMFQEKGYTVFRFTGSEIYKNAWECAFQIWKWADDKAWK